MSFVEQLGSSLKAIAESGAQGGALGRIRAEIEFAGQFAELFPETKGKWQKLVLKAAETVRKELSTAGPIDLQAAVAEAEEIMAPIGQAAKEYTIHCCGHAHIDMNWMWPWQETVSVSQDTFRTVDRLMDEFPEFHFSQSQASTYIAMEEYCPEVFETIKKRIKEGRWEPTASMWVEGDKNMASGEILCRHLLYTRRYFNERFGLPYDAIKIDWECDTFGHCHTLPAILNRGGVTRYYFHRTGPHQWLYWWQAPDGSKVLAYRDKLGYNGAIEPWISHWLVDYVKETGLKDWMYLYGVGDHGGGPTRRDLMRAAELNSWPVFPTVKLSTTDAYFTAVENDGTNIPVVNGELNYVFEGCYTSQSNIKRANRVSENILPEMEAISLVAGTAGFPYPRDEIRRGWRYAMFNQFHDILPGSGVHATYEYAQGLFQEVLAITQAARTRALRRLASQVNTSAASSIKPPAGTMGASIGDGTGAGAGDPGVPGGVSAYNIGAVSAEPFLVFNQLAFPRTEMVYAKVWNKDFPADRICVRDDAGNLTAGQVVGTGNYWGHNFTTVCFPAEDVPGTGYRVYTVDRVATPIAAEGVKVTAPGVMENEFVRVEVDQASGAVKHLIDKSTGYDLVPEGELAGVLELFQEAPRGMTAWEIGQIQRVTRFTDDGIFEVVHRGPHRAAVRTRRRIGDSRVAVEIGLNVGSPMVDFTVTAHWVERGTPETGVPMLRIGFPVRIAEPKANYEIAFGSIERPANGHEVPALRWADLSGKRIETKGSCGITMVNADKYGHNADENTMRLTLLRSTYDPDPLPEMGDHNIRLAIMPHDGMCSISEATRMGAAFNLPMSVASTDIHEGKLPSRKGFVEVLTPNVMLAAVKKAEDSEALIMRLYEMDGKDTEAKVRITDLVKPGTPARQVDLMEQPIPKAKAHMDGDTLVVRVPAHGIASVMLG
jgi:alpha-mannosidase